MTTTEPIKPTSGGGRPKEGYFLSSGRKVPSVTEINIYKDPGPLIGWAYRMGKEGKNMRAERDDAGDSGRITHNWVEDDLHGKTPRVISDVKPSVLARAEKSFEAYLWWRKNADLVVVDTERPLVSEMFSYGGTFDCLALFNGRPVILDWKTSSGVYPETRAQIAAYRQLIRENCGSKRYVTPETGACIRFDKVTGDFAEHRFSAETLDSGWRRFLGAKMIYDEDCLEKTT